LRAASDAPVKPPWQGGTTTASQLSLQPHIRFRNCRHPEYARGRIPLSLGSLSAILFLTPREVCHDDTQKCQPTLKIDPPSASKFDPLDAVMMTFIPALSGHSAIGQNWTPVIAKNGSSLKAALDFEGYNHKGNRISFFAHC